MDRTLRALNRFGLGARIGERRRISDPRGWLQAQLEGGVAPVPAPAGAQPAAIEAALRAYRMVGKGARDDRRQARRRLTEIAAAESRAALTIRAGSDRPFVERLVAFWSNHLCVSASARLLVAPLAGAYERDAIRPHVLGRFADLVLASARHPAMLVYLDNLQSVGPNSPGARPARMVSTRRGLNENYARELLELHTLGVDGGYTQKDVQELAKILTGWTADGLSVRPATMRRARPPASDEGAGRIRFVFREPSHEPGSKTVLGTAYAESGEAEGEQAIRALCRHPSTARFVATKMATHFVADAPPAAAIDGLARVFRDTDGDLAVVSRALIDMPEAWQDDGRKFRTPQDWVVAALRAFPAAEIDEQLLGALRQLRHPLWSPQSPAGFPDRTQAWADPDSLLNRAELARTLARRLQRDFDPRQLLEVVEVPDGTPLPALLADRSIPADERIALAIAGPAFQWR